MRKKNKHAEAFRDFLGERKMRNTGQRDKVLNTLLAANRHISAADLYILIKAQMPSIGYATVCRNLKLLCEMGLAREIKIGNSKSLYEAKLLQEHHDHLICLSCGALLEFYDEALERLQEDIAKANNFHVSWHKMEIYGHCERCAQEQEKK